jgi:hypothetical protein
MIEKQKQGAKQAVQELYRAGRISLKMAIWVMKNAGYSRKETEEWLEMESRPMEKTGEKR